MKKQLRYVSFLLLCFTASISFAQSDITGLGCRLTDQYKDSPANEGLENLIDNSTATKYLTFNAGTWVQMQQVNASVVAKYSLTSANDADTRDPLNWTFAGSTNGTDWTTLDTRTNQDFPTRLLRKEYTFTNTTSYAYYRLTMTNNSGTILQLAEIEIIGTGGGGKPPLPPPPLTWQEHWLEHVQLLNRKFLDADLAVYHDPDVNAAVTWPNTYLGDAWRYTKSVYGSFGEDEHLYAIFHTGRYGGGHPSTYFDGSHDYRNVIDCGAGPWTSGTGNDLDMTTHEIAHIVEGGSKGFHNSPAFGIWGDSKWAEIFNYDVYVGMGRTADATRWYNMMINNTDNFPVANTHWFRDWFYPIYHNHGGTQTLNKYFTLLAQYYPKNGKNYDGDMNWGEFVHFWSGAACTNLKPQATTAFGWTTEWENQFIQAQLDFPFTYNCTVTSVENGTDAHATEGLKLFFNQDIKALSIIDPTNTNGTGTVSVYSLNGCNVAKATVELSSNAGALDLSTLSNGLYVVLFDYNGKTYRQTISVMK